MGDFIGKRITVGCNISNIDGSGTSIISSHCSSFCNDTGIVGFRNRDSLIAASKYSCIFRSGVSNAIIGAFGAQICKEASYSSIVAGDYNRIYEGGLRNFIGGGGGNFVCQYAGSNAIVGGEEGKITGNLSFIGGGWDNRAQHCVSAVIGGSENCTSADCQVRVTALSKSSGTFRIDHPDPEKKHTHYLSHSFVESPNAGDNIYRFTVMVENGTAVIDLPDYYKYLNTDDQVWINPQGHYGVGYGVVNEDQTQLTVFANEDGEYNVQLIGTRKDFEAKHHWQGVETYK